MRGRIPGCRFAPSGLQRIGSKPSLLSVFLDHVVKKLFVGLDAFATFEVAELHTFNGKHNFDPGAGERESHSKPFGGALLDVEVDALFPPGNLENPASAANRPCS